MHETQPRGHDARRNGKQAHCHDVANQSSIHPQPHGGTQRCSLGGKSVSVSVSVASEFEMDKDTVLCGDGCVCSTARGVVDACRVCLVGTVMHTPVFGRLEVLHQAAMCVSMDGSIAHILQPCAGECHTPSESGDDDERKRGDITMPPEMPASSMASGRYCSDFLRMFSRVGKLRVLPPGHVLLPGMVDCHFHAPQWPLMGRGMNLPLAEWLQKHAFPAERACADLAYATRLYNALVPALCARGTTTALFFATIHLDATKALVDACLAHGLRGFVGKV